MSNANTRILSLAVSHVNMLCHRVTVCNAYSFRWIKSYLYPIFNTVKVQVVRNYTKFTLF